MSMSFSGDENSTGQAGFFISIHHAVSTTFKSSLRF
jgi:hypothetical protein